VERLRSQPFQPNTRKSGTEHLGST
jgi:hypothetical protein